MSSFGRITLTGKSGKTYRFTAYPLGTVFKKGFAAVYVLTQRTLRSATGAARHKPLLFGHSADLGQPKANKAAANCVCVHADQDEKERLAIELDLTATSGQRRTR